MIKHILVFIFLISITFSISSTSYNVSKIHIAVSGDTGNSTSYSSRFTLTYQQPSEEMVYSASYYLNFGWFDRPALTIASASTSFGIFEFPYLWRVNRDSRRTRIITGISKPI